MNFTRSSGARTRNSRPPLQRTKAWPRFSARLAVNKRLIETKKREPSAPVTLEPLADVAQPLIDRIAAANASIAAHNALVDNLASERGTLVGQVWQCLLNENSAMIAKHQTESEALRKAVEGLTAGIAAKQGLLTAAKAELRELEKRVTSVQPTVTEINRLLASFGFTGFRLKTAGDRDHLYEIVRDNGDDAAATLSEGEKSFLCFLYFYHLLRGSVSESEVTSDRVVVFDDPVSSLDSDVLFIVSPPHWPSVKPQAVGNDEETCRPDSQKGVPHANSPDASDPTHSQRAVASIVCFEKRKLGERSPPLQHGPQICNQQSHPGENVRLTQVTARVGSGLGLRSRFRTLAVATDEPTSRSSARGGRLR